MSYHFQMTGPAGQYVEDHYLIRIGSNGAEPVRQTDFSDANPRPYLRIRHHRGLPNAHFYARRLNTSDAFGLSTIVTFAETPPGVLGAAIAVSFATSVLVTAFMILGVTRSNAAQLNTDLPALLLASPAFATSVIGFKTDGDSLLRTSLSSRLGLLVSGILSFCSALLYIAQLKGHLTKPSGALSFADGLLSFKPVNGWWVALAAFSILCSMYMAVAVVARTRRYTLAVERKGMLDNPYPTK
jgi:hypothetical protein